MTAGSITKLPENRILTRAALAGLVLLRVVIGWHFLYEGLSKLLMPDWSAESYLLLSQGFLSGFFHWLASDPSVVHVVSLLNIWGLILIGLALITGWFTRVACVSGIVLLALYYFSSPPWLGGSLGASTEGSYLIVNKDLVEMMALVVLSFVPTGRYLGLDRIMSPGKIRSWLHRKMVVIGEDPAGNQIPVRGIRRRELLRGLATTAVLAPFAFVIQRKLRYESYEERILQDRYDAVTGATSQSLNPGMLSDLKGQVPRGMIGDLEASRIILGGNLINGYAHARDLIYVNSLVKAYHTTEKVLETLWLAEQCGIDTMIFNLQDGHRFALEYQKRNIGNTTFIVQCAAAKNLRDRVSLAIDLGARGAYIQMVGNLVREGKFDEIHRVLETLRSNGLAAGIGDHFLEPIQEAVSHGIEPDFIMKTFHPTGYWSYIPERERKDNIYCEDREETIEFMRNFIKPWIAFKTLAAGSVHPEAGFRHAFENGADFICVGMYDFQVVENSNLVIDMLTNGMNRERPWIGSKLA